MGMFDHIKVKKPLPLTEELSKLGLNWSEEVFQTKDLENLLDLYEISEDGKLKHLAQEREWKKDESSPLGGFLEVKSEHWEEVPFHGVLYFYTSYCDVPSLHCDLLCDAEARSWEEIVLTEGYDWWIEFKATFDAGTLREVVLEKVEKTPVRVRLAHRKEWAQKRQAQEKKIFNRVIRGLRKIPFYRDFTRKLYRLEQTCHEKVSAGIRKIS